MSDKLKNNLNTLIDILLLGIVDERHFRHCKGEAVLEFLHGLLELVIRFAGPPLPTNAILRGLVRRNQDA